MASVKKICDVCLRFPWHNLPAEDAGGQQHHATRSALEVSAKECPVCNLVLRAAVANYRDSRGTRGGKGYWRQHNCIHYKDASGTHQMNVVKELGMCLPIGPITPSNIRSRTIVSCVPVQEIGAMAPGYRSGQTILMPTGPVDSDFCVGDSMVDQDQGNRDLEAETADLPVWAYGNWWCHRDTRKAGLHPHLMGVGARFGRTASPWDAINTSPGKVHLRGSNIRLRTNDGTSFEHIPGRVTETNSNSVTAFKRLKTWIDECESGHLVCASPPGVSALPRRVLDLNSAHGSIKLVKTNCEKSRYVALSHGRSQTSCISTTTSNLTDHERGIALLDLPPTFRDAISITRQIGVRYLWIDRLCIVQDDPLEQEGEMAAIAYIYRDAYLTISAAHTKDVYGGCFPLQPQGSVPSPASRSLGYNSPPVAELHSIGFLTGQGTPSFVHLSEEWLPGSSGALPQFSNIGAFGQHWDPISEEPLSSCGWALQERLLSRRIVHYTKSQMYFECQCGLQSEDGFHIPNTYFSLQRVVHAQKMTAADRISAELSGPSYVRGGPSRMRNVPRLQAGWHSLVEDYSRRQNVNSAEKLAAIAGAARVIAELTGDKYLAGLWRSHIFEDLLWRTQNATRTYSLMHGSEGEHITRPHLYRAPSWSWAALDTPIHFQHLEQEPVAQLIRCSTTVSGLDVYGSVSDGELEIIGPLYELHAAEPSLPNNGPSTSVYMEKTMDGGMKQKFIGLFYPDVSNGNPRSPCYALFFDSLHALVIQPQEDGGKQPQVLTTELVRERTETELPNWGWRNEGNMLRVGIAEFKPRTVGGDQMEHTAGWSEDVVGALTLNDVGSETRMMAPASQDDVPICVLLK